MALSHLSVLTYLLDKHNIDYFLRPKKYEKSLFENLENLNQSLEKKSSSEFLKRVNDCDDDIVTEKIVEDNDEIILSENKNDDLDYDNYEY